MIYLITDYQTRVCKIGYSQDPIKRLKQLQTGNPNSLELVSILDDSNYTEIELHNQFKQFRLEGEWFKLCPEIEEVFKINKQTKIAVYDYLLDLIVTTLSAPEIKVFFWCVENSYDNFITLNKDIKSDLSKRSNLKLSTIDNAISSLTKHSLLFKLDKHTFKLNKTCAHKI